MSDMLFDLDVDLEPAAQDDDGSLDLRAGDDSWASCRHCQLLTTTAGIEGRGHGAGSATCARALAMYGGAA